MIVVIDASVAVKWIVVEPRHEIALDLLSDGIVRHAPDLILSEVANALRKKHQLGHVSAAQAHAGFDDIPAYFRDLAPPSKTIHEAFQLGIDFNHATMDCVYLALARQIGGILITDDEKFVAKCRLHGQESIVLPLADWPIYRQAASFH